MRKIIISFIAAVTFMALPVVSQSNDEKSIQIGSSSEVQEEQSAKSEESNISLNIDDTSEGYDAGAGFSFWDVLRVILVLALVIACIYFVLWLLRKSMKVSPKDDPFLRKVASIDLAPGKSVQIVTLVDKAYIVGVSDDSINLISEINDKDLVDSMNVYSDQHKNVKKPRSFEDLLNIFTKKASSETESEGSGEKKGAGEKLVDLLKKQRERLNGDEK